MECKNIVKEVIGELSLNKRKKLSFYSKQLKKILTKTEYRHIKFLSFYNGILSIGIDSSAWLYHLHQKKEKILEDLGLKDVKFCLKG
ncbi:MAG: DUF721 domain-containing protein [Candidatus Omnitrophica bacterium]|nr:DUF721 domain-containing protein [Candidatus Omnitrophota bacterium]MCM8799144.1 DUF721 domain-containing protein [Candidatus Omnitrophota bacterium]